MTCKDCIHYAICIFHYEGNENEKCCNFKPKSSFVELPCEVGQTVWFVCFGKIYEHKIKRFEITEFGMYACSSSLEFNFDHFGKTVFLSRELAEEALNEQKKL